MKTFAEKLIQYYRSLRPPDGLPVDVQVLYPYGGKDTIEVMKSFFCKFYNDHNSRRLVLGINPGRFGAGTTGINFTGPRQLKNYCGIDHPFKDQSELSAEFIYEMIESFGGPELFYGKYFIGAVSPLGYVKKGINMNYYDDRVLLESVRPFIIKNLEDLVKMGFETDTCHCIGGDRNFKILSEINSSYGFFNNIIPLPHPRFIMQYRRKQKEQYIREYIKALES